MHTIGKHLSPKLGVFSEPVSYSDGTNSAVASVRPSVRPSVNTHIFFSETKRRKSTGFVLLERPRSPHVTLFMRRPHLLGLDGKLRTNEERSYKIEVHLLYK